MAEIPMHYVATWDEAEKLIGARNDFFLETCGCREEQGRCRRSRHDVCLIFGEEHLSKGKPSKRVSKTEAVETMKYAIKEKLVARPFRDHKTRTETTGICCCCDDCCGYFLNKDEICDKGAFVQETAAEECTDCGACETACHFGARKMVDGNLEIIAEDCYGCGLCADACPEACIQMVERK